MQDAERRYVSRAWGLMTKDKGWIKPLLVLGAANLVPIVGPLGTGGYGLEWARLTAWGVDAAPKQKNVKMGACIRSGWRGFIASLGYVVILALLTYLIQGGEEAGGIRGFIVWVLGVLLAGFASIASLRATIYQNFTAAYRVDRISEMIKRDGSGFLRVIVCALLVDLGVGLLGFVVAALCIAPALSSIFALGFAAGAGGYGADYYLVQQIGSTISQIMPVILVFIYFASILSAWASLMTMTMWGLWMRQFDVPAWGSSADPLPAQTQVKTISSLPAPHDKSDDGRQP